MRDCLIYGLVDPRNLLVCYVGMSSQGMKRPYQHLPSCKRDSAQMREWMVELARWGLKFTVAVLQQSTMETLKQDERWWIAYGRMSAWPLRNLREGGDGPTRLHASTLAKLSSAAKARMAVPENRAKIAAAMKKRMSTPEARQRASEQAKQQFSSPEARATIAARNKALMSTPEAIARNKARYKSTIGSPEARARLVKVTMERFAGPEVRASHGAAVSARMSTPEEKARQGALTRARLATPAQRATHAAKIRAGMARPEVRAKLLGAANPAKRPEAREKMRVSALLRCARQREKRQLPATEA